MYILPGYAHLSTRCNRIKESPYYSQIVSIYSDSSANKIFICKTRRAIIDINKAQIKITNTASKYILEVKKVVKISSDITFELVMRLYSSYFVASCINETIIVNRYAKK